MNDNNFKMIWFKKTKNKKDTSWAVKDEQFVTHRSDTDLEAEGTKLRWQSSQCESVTELFTGAARRLRAVRLTWSSDDLRGATSSPRASITSSPAFVLLLLLLPSVLSLKPETLSTLFCPSPLGCTISPPFLSFHGIIAVFWFLLHWKLCCCVGAVFQHSTRTFAVLPIISFFPPSFNILNSVVVANHLTTTASN